MMNMIKNKIINKLSNFANYVELSSEISELSCSSYLWDIIIPGLGYIIILISLLGIGGSTAYFEISHVIIDWFFAVFSKIQFRTQKYFWYIIAFIFLIHIFMCTLVFMIYNIKVLCFLMDFLPVLGLVGLYYFNPSLVKAELVKKITFLAGMLIFGFTFVGLFFISLYIYEPHNLKIYFSLLISIRSIFGVLILVGIIIYLIFIPWTKDNLIKTGVLFLSLLLVGTLLNTTGKLSSYMFSYVNNKDLIQFKNNSIYTDDFIEKVDLDQFSLKNLVGKGLSSKGLPSEGLSCEDFFFLNSQRPKSAIFDYLDLSKIKPINGNQDFVKLNYGLSGKLPKISLLNGFIQIDLNKSVAKSPLLSDDRFYDISPPMSIRPGPQLPQTFYIKDGFFCIDIKFHGGSSLVRYDPEIKQGFVVNTYRGIRKVYEFKVTPPYKGRGSNILVKLPKSAVNLNDSSFSQKGLDFPMFDYSRSKPSISAPVPSDFKTLYGLPFNFNEIRSIDVLDLSLFTYEYLLDAANKYNSLFTKTSFIIKVPYSFEKESLKWNPLRTDRLIIRPLNPEDLYEYSLLTKDPEVNFYSCLWYSDSEWWAIKSRLENSVEKDNVLKLGVFLNKKGGELLKRKVGDEGELIGEIHVYWYGRDFPDIYYLFKKKYWGHGYGSEALKELLNYYFSLRFKEVVIKLPSLNYIDNKYNGTKVLNISTFAFNERSENLLKKMGANLWYSELDVWSKEVTPLTRLIEKRGYDILRPDGYEYYNWFKHQLDPLHVSYVWPKYIRSPTLSEEDGFFIFKYRNLYRAIHRNEHSLKYLKLFRNNYIHPQNINQWLLSEEDFEKKR